jgi:hypothetical protein
MHTNTILGYVYKCYVLCKKKKGIAFKLNGKYLSSENKNILL